MRLLFVILRVAVALAIGAAIIAQLAKTVSIAFDANPASVGFVVVNFFSFFTVDSNAASVVVLLVGAGLAIRQGGLSGGSRYSDQVVYSDPLLYTTVRASVVTYMVTTGIVYNLLLRGIALPQGTTVAWSNEILHVVGPIYLLLDWLFAPGRVPLDWKRLWAIIAFPVVWVAYTLVRGPLAIDQATGKPWYPYPFLNPTTSAAGYASVAFYVVLIAVVISALGAGAIWVSRRPSKRATVNN
ncbi:Pr6Pr family membrane protein [Subtercola sp. PAMC28395]|uniref:Pr6Pr family membrane protein n=1 Tax=Subtercola sp. PAMC28395 TaxID=2846775 RepID=UPI001C0B0933|nr:Pr6Pr family membrane protein [Subtercola sp. PAMC28395]QWT23825.1 Pr6Pr family membrane protein [Subtercola sp. PAMC28395]